MSDRWLPRLLLRVVSCVVWAGMLLTLPCQADAASLFYVAVNGNDANPGTLSRPWRTIQKAANAATPGSTVYVRNGIYNSMFKFS